MVKFKMSKSSPLTRLISTFRFNSQPETKFIIRARRAGGWSRSTVATVVLTANQGQGEAADPAGGQLGGERPRARD